MLLLEYSISKDIIAFSTKRGGKGKGNYDEFNITDYCGDTEEHVAICRKELCCKIGIDDANLLLPRQTHQTNILSIDNDFTLLDKESRKEKLYAVDAVVTNIKGVCIGVSTADCIPILLFDGDNKTIAAIHAGWRGTEQHIVTKTIEYIKKNYTTKPQNLKAIICPGISIDAFEVGDEVYNSFHYNGFDMNKIAKRYNKWHIDLKEANKIELLNNGVLSENIQDCAICTYTNHNEYFSARRLGINSGRIFNGIMIKR